MSGYAHEWEAAKIDGVAAQWHAVAVAFEGEGKLERVRCLRLDAARKPIPGSEFTLPAQLALIAIGQSKLTALLTGLPGIRAQGGQIVADADGFTGRKGWYVGGDLRNGGKEVVNAAAEGKAAARAIHATLMGVPRG
jgi:glutamate synthase (NADPH/NADH) small chain